MCKYVTLNINNILLHESNVNNISLTLNERFLPEKFSDDPPRFTNYVLTWFSTLRPYVYVTIKKSRGEEGSQFVRRERENPRNEVSVNATEHIRTQRWSTFEISASNWPSGNLPRKFFYPYKRVFRWRVRTTENSAALERAQADFSADRSINLDRSNKRKPSVPPWYLRCAKQNEDFSFLIQPRGSFPVRQRWRWGWRWGWRWHDN